MEERVGRGIWRFVLGWVVRDRGIGGVYFV